MIMTGIYYYLLFLYWNSQKKRISILIDSEYGNVRSNRVRPTLISENNNNNKVKVEEVSEEEANGISNPQIHAYPNAEGVPLTEDNAVEVISSSENIIEKSINEIKHNNNKKTKNNNNNLSMIEYNDRSGTNSSFGSTLSLVRYKKKVIQPKWHAPWKLMRVISGHLGWVRCIAIDHTNEWFATGGNDRTIKVYILFFFSFFSFFSSLL